MSETFENTIMVVEDEDLLLQAISKKLSLNKIKAITCTTGAQALDYLKNMETLPDAVWLDYHLPDMEGLAIMEALKANPKWENLPVFVISNSASDQKVHHMLALGAKKYIVKAEHRLDEIIKEIIEFIKLEK